MPNAADVVIIGAGPAGLAAASGCKAACASALVLETGKEADLRDRHSPQDIGEGLGGAGLFSDGKFSFYPSATELWRLEPTACLTQAYEWTSSLLRQFQISAPPFPQLNPEPLHSAPEDGFQLKEYSSVRMPLSQRSEFIRVLANGETIKPMTTVTHVEIEGNRVIVGFRQHDEDAETCLSAKALVVATGRLGAIQLLSWLKVPTVFRRLELGIRIEQPAQSFFLRDARGLDPKLIARDSSGAEWRTFCCCRNGEVVGVLSNGFLAKSGRSDSEPTVFSNVAFNVRITDAESGAAVARHVLGLLRQQSRSFSLHVDDLGNDLKLQQTLDDTFGAEVAHELMLGLKRLRDAYSIKGPVVVHGPTIEGVGFYPVLGPNLRLDKLPVWLPGDVGGLFRGLTAALVSGYFAGIQCARYACA